MKVLVYDPLYSEVGHFYRYNKYVLTMLSRLHAIDEIVYLASGDEGALYEHISEKIKCVSSVTSIKTDRVNTGNVRGMERVCLYVKAIRGYWSIIRYINATDTDWCFFTSNGTLPFWAVSLIGLKKRFVISVISLRWLYDNAHFARLVFYAAYVKFLRSAGLVFVTESCYASVVSKHGIQGVQVLHDRFLGNCNKELASKTGSNGMLRLISLGTVSKEKSPLEFVRALSDLEGQALPYEYRIYGKATDESGLELKSLANRSRRIHYVDQYVNQEEYRALLQQADFVVIPYDARYTKFMTSGVMWDCFEVCKPILCPDVELFRYYIDTYKIGFIYSPSTLGGIIKHLCDNKELIVRDIRRNYRQLQEWNSEKNVLMRFRRAIEV